ncbi:MAG: hypothetical protein PHX83_04085 [Acidobacteriia bacterium]|nr:hypothetical protein [Terriglobia bacterium]
MHRFLTSTVIACLTRQDIELLIGDLKSPSNSITLEHAWAGSTDGKLLCLFAATDRAALEAFLKAKRVHTEWSVLVDMEFD